MLNSGFDYPKNESFFHKIWLYQFFAFKLHEKFPKNPTSRLREKVITDRLTTSNNLIGPLLAYSWGSKKNALRPDRMNHIKKTYKRSF